MSFIVENVRIIRYNFEVMVHVYSSNPQSDSRWQISRQVMTLLLIVGVMFVIVFSAYSFYKKFKEPVSLTIDAIPLNAACIIDVHEWNQLADDLREGKVNIWNSFIRQKGGAKLASELFYIDSLLAQNEEISNKINNGNAYLSFHKQDSASVNMLFSLQVGNNGIANEIDRFFFEQTKRQSSIYGKIKGVVVKKTFLHKINKTYYYAIVKGVFIGSFDQQLISTSINNVFSGRSLNKNAAFRKVKAAAGSSENIHIYIQYAEFSPLLNNLIRTDRDLLSLSLNRFAEWSVFDVKLSDNHLLLNGITALNDSIPFYLTQYRIQKPSGISVSSILPSSTVLFMHQSVSDYPALIQQQRRLFNRKASLDTINLMSFVSPWIGPEITLAVIDSGCGLETDSSVNQLSSRVFAVIRTTDVELALSKMSKLADTLKCILKDSSSEKSGHIRNLGCNNIVPMLFGQQFSAITESYYTSIDDYILFGNCPEQLQWIKLQYSLGQTLTASSKYKEVSSLLSESSNMMLYANMQNLTTVIQEIFHKEVAEMYLQMLPFFMKYNSLAIQYTMKEDIFLSNVILSTAGNVEEEYKERVVLLDTTIFKHPYLFYDAIDSLQKMVVFDCKKNMYITTMEGEVLVKKSIPELPMGDIHAIDYYKNGRLQFVFNTENFICGYDHNGSTFNGYPIRLPFKSTGKMVVVDFDTIQDYRFLIPSENKLYNYNKEGKEPAGWKQFEMPGKIAGTIRCFSVGDKDIIAVSDNLGNIGLAARKGTPLFKQGVNIKKGLLSDFYLGRLRGKPVIISSDTKGSIVFIDTTGRVEFVKTPARSKWHQFIMDDINSDRVPEYIYSDNGHLVVCDFKGQQMAVIKTSQGQYVAPTIYNLSGYNKRLSYMDASAKTCYLFNEELDTKQMKSYRGATVPIFYKSELQDVSLMISATDNKVYFHSIVW